MDRDGEGRLRSSRRPALTVLVVLTLVAVADLAMRVRRRLALQLELDARYVEQVLRSSGEF